MNFNTRNFTVGSKEKGKNNNLLGILNFPKVGLFIIIEGILRLCLAGQIKFIRAVSVVAGAVFHLNFLHPLDISHG